MQHNATCEMPVSFGPIIYSTLDATALILFLLKTNRSFFRVELCNIRSDAIERVAELYPRPTNVLPWAIHSSAGVMENGKRRKDCCHTNGGNGGQQGRAVAMARGRDNCDGRRRVRW